MIGTYCSKCIIHAYPHTPTVQLDSSHTITVAPQVIHPYEVKSWMLIILHLHENGFAVVLIQKDFFMICILQFAPAFQ